MADRTSLARATDGSDSPTPGYLYLDIAKSVASSPVACAETLAYLRRRMSQHNNPNIKFKSLKVLSMVASSPVTRGALKREMVKDPKAISSIKECLAFSGPTDPIRGDAPYQKVRDAAKECLDIAYSDDNIHNNNNNTMSMMNIQTDPEYSSSNFGGLKKMEGIGNPMFADPRLEQSKTSQGIGSMTISEVMSTAKEGFKGMINDPFARNIPSSRTSSSSYNPNHRSNTSYGSSVPPPGQRELTQATGGQWTMASNRGPNAYRPNMAPVSTTGVGGSWATSTATGSATSTTTTTTSGGMVSSTAYTNHSSSGSSSGGKAVADGSFEKNLVAELCPPGGMKAVPPPDKLDAFAASLKNLDADLVCPALLDCLEDGQPWIIRAKALCVIEVCCSTPQYADFFHACAAEIQPLASHSRAAVRDPAKRVLISLGLPTTTTPPTTTDTTVTAADTTTVTTAAATVVTTPPPDLLDFGDSTVPAPPPTSAPPPPPPPPTTPAAPPQQPPPPPPTTVSSDMFGGMNIKSTATAVEVEHPTTTNTNDIFGELSLKQPKSTEETTHTNNNTTISTSTSSTATPAVLDNMGGSAFSFMNATPTETKPTSTNVPVTSTTPSNNAASFDPFLSFGGNDTNHSSQQQQQQQQQVTMQQQQMAMMATNPQMQAAFFAQQQNQLLMMQMQMQQLQMGANYNNNNNNLMMQPAKVPVMGGGTHAHAGGVSTSFAFMDDPAKVQKEKQNKTFDFVKDAMKGAK